MRILGLLFLAIIGIVSSKNTYIVTVPQRIRPASTADISITPLKNRVRNIRVRSWLQDKNNKTLSRVDQRLATDLQKPSVVKLKIPQNIDTTGNYKIRVKASGGLAFDKTAVDIRVSSKASSIFIQTDRPIYKPGDKVQFRVFGTNPTLKVLDDPIDIIIQDPKRNRVKQFIGVKPVFGVFAGSFQLSSLTNFGSWQIKVEQGREKNTKSFTVEKYVLPKFEVNIATPPFELITDRFFVATITAMYTFGKPVEGDVVLTVNRRWGSAANAIRKTFKMKGKATIRILMSELKPRYRTDIEIVAKVTESVTGIEVKGTGAVTIHDTPEKLMFSSGMPSVFKPGLQYTIVLRVTQQDDSPLKPPLGTVNVTVEYSVPSLVNTQPVPVRPLGDQVMPSRQSFPPSRPVNTETLWSKVVRIPTSGLIVLQAAFPVAAESGTIKANYRRGSAHKSVSRAESPSKNYIQVTVRNNRKAKPGQKLPLNIKATERIHTCSYKIFSKGSIVSHGRLLMRNRKTGRHEVMITAIMAPQAKLLVYYTRRNGEIVADAISFSIEDIFKNEVSLSFNKQQAKPAEKVDLKIKADPQSLVSVLAVDKSILLLRTGNDITTQDVLNELQQYDNSGFMPRFDRWDSWMPRPAYGKDAFSIFNGAGVYVLTDAVLFQHVTEPNVYRTLNSNIMAPMGAVASSDGGEIAGLGSPTRTRTNFPETWLWVNRTTSADGTATITATAPDTITQWITSAFAVNPVSGLGVASETAKLTTFQNFFMRFELPYSAIRGEVIILQITVFNFLKKDFVETIITGQTKDLPVGVVVKLNKNDKISFADSNGNPFTPPGTGGWSKTVTVKKDGVGSVFFPILPTALGKIPLHATATSSAAADSVQRDILIEAEGIKQSYNVPLLVDLRQQNKFTEDIELSFPPNLVKDSEFIKVQVIGDLMGPTLSGIEDLLKMSYGCGEQNMIGFVPNVFVSTYLTATNRLSEDIKAKVETFLEAGYQRELSFVHHDGSFSAFGTNDRSGTTWLTAFVVKSFAQAAEFTFIDIKVMTKAIKWLLKQQTQSGAFNEPGIILHKEMQGGSTSSKRSLAAFVLIALQEAKAKDQVELSIKQQVDAAITETTAFIAKGAPASIANLYELAIVFYALTLVNHPIKEQVLTTLEKKAVTRADEKFWTLPATEADIIQPWKSNWNPPKTKVRALDVETTSYILLAYNKRDDTTNGIKILKWLGRQRNSNGGYISTQDTVVALQALSGLGEKIYVPSFKIAMNAKGNTWPGKTFNVDNSNSLVLQSEDIPSSVRKVSVQGTGTGLCLVEAAVYFNVHAELREPAFRLVTFILNDSVKGFKLRTCFSWAKGGQSTMGYLEISIPTGMDADLDTINTSQTGGLFKKSEKAFRQINLYFDAITTKEMCTEVNINRVSLVARHKPVPIRLSEYYEPSNEVIKLYQSQALANATIVEVCGADNCIEVKKR